MYVLLYKIFLNLKYLQVKLEIGSSINRMEEIPFHWFDSFLLMTESLTDMYQSFLLIRFSINCYGPGKLRDLFKITLHFYASYSFTFNYIKHVGYFKTMVFTFLIKFFCQFTLSQYHQRTCRVALQP